MLPMHWWMRGKKLDLRANPQALSTRPGYVRANPGLWREVETKYGGNLSEPTIRGSVRAISVVPRHPAPHFGHRVYVP